MTKKSQHTKSPPSFSALVQEFFTNYIVEQRALSPCTVAAYRDAFILFLSFVEREIDKSPTELKLIDITPKLILAFLDYLEQERHNTVRSRNARLAVIGEPDTTWFSQRDHLLMTLLYNTGARVSEIIAVRVADIVIDETACVHLHGKGRKQRSVPLWHSTVLEIKIWLQLNVKMGTESALLPNRNGHKMTRSNAEKRFDLAIKSAEKQHESLKNRHISPHTIRHTTAMHLLQSGVDISVIALWLGHESSNTTHMYLEADLAMKKLALAKIQEPNSNFHQYKAPDTLIQFLKTL